MGARIDQSLAAQSVPDNPTDSGAPSSSNGPATVTALLDRASLAGLIALYGATRSASTGRPVKFAEVSTIEGAITVPWLYAWGYLSALEAAGSLQLDNNSTLPSTLAKWVASGWTPGVIRDAVADRLASNPPAGTTWLTDMANANTTLAAIDRMVDERSDSPAVEGSGAPSA